MYPVEVDDQLPRAGERIVLRRLSTKDLPHFQAYRHSPVLGKYQGWKPQDDAPARSFLEEMSRIQLFLPDTWCQLAIASHVDDELIGDIGISVTGDGLTAKIGYTLALPYHGRGLASEAVREAIKLAFDATAALRVLAETDVRNTSSIKLLERVGMHLVATQKVEYGGEEHTVHIYEMERSNILPL